MEKGAIRMKKISVYVLTLLTVMVSIISGFSNQTVLLANGGKVEEIKKAGKIVLGTSADYKPYEFHTTIDGKDTIVGFDIDVAKAIADGLGVELEIKDMGFSGLLAALQSGTVDIILAGMQATEERKASVDFSIPYFKEKNLYITKTMDVGEYKSNDDLAGKRIGVQQGTTQEFAGEELKEQYPDIEVVAVTNLLDIMQQVKNGTLDGMIIADTVALTMLKSEVALATVDTVEIEHAQAGTSVAVAKGNADLVAEINKVLEQLLADNKIETFMNAAAELDEVTAENTNAGGAFSFLKTYWPMILKGAGITVIVAFFSVIFGAIGGTLLAILRLSKNKILQAISVGYIDFIRGTPLLIQVYIIFYGLPALGIRLPALIAGILAMSINSIAYVAEIIRAGILAVDKGQFEAGESLGMKRALLMKEIILPQAIKNILPALGNEFVTIIKESSILSIITVADLMFVANTIRGNTFQAFTPLIVVAVIYFVLTFTLSKGLNFIERGLKKNA